MKDDHDAKAAGFMAQYGYADTYARDDLADLLRATAAAAWNAAKEEAAKVAENTPDSGICTMDDVENNHAAKIAHAIRSLSSKPAGGNDG